MTVFLLQEQSKKLDVLFAIILIKNFLKEFEDYDDKI